MTLQLSKAQSDRLQQMVQCGRFSSIEVALEAALTALESESGVDDAWASAMIEEALQSIDRGEGSPWVKGEALKKLHARYPELADDRDR